jgi:hypothetical protein
VREGSWQIAEMPECCRQEVRDGRPSAADVSPSAASMRIRATSVLAIGREAVAGVNDRADAGVETAPDQGQLTGQAEQRREDITLDDRISDGSVNQR